MPREGSRFFHLQLHPKVQVRHPGLPPIRSRAWRSMRVIGSRISSACSSSFKGRTRVPLGPSPSPYAPVSRSSSPRPRPRPRLRISRLGRVRNIRLGASHKLRSLVHVRRLVSCLSRWLGTVVRSKAKIGMAFVGDALKLIITSLHAHSASAEMSISGYQMAPYLDEVIIQRSTLKVPKSSAPKLVHTSGVSRQRIQFLAPRIGRWRPPVELDTIAESAFETEILV